MISVQFSVKTSALVTPLPRLYKRRNQHAKINNLQIKNTSAAPEESAAKIEHNHHRHQQQQFPSQLQKEKLPKHVGISVDGCSRWARSRGLPTSMGHQACFDTLKDIVKLSYEWGIQALTIFVFSTENWRRPKAEVDFIMMHLENFLNEKLKDLLLEEDVRVCFIGGTTKLPVTLQKAVKEVTESTKNNSKMSLVMAVSYSGRLDIVQACRRIAARVKEGVSKPEDIDEAMFDEELETNCISEFPNPDLVIRTSGELRLSNFLLWQSAYSELYFADVLWPDFKETDYVQALASFQRRQRRFGQRID